MTSVDEMDEVVLKSYEKDFGNTFDITDYNKEKGQLVICGTIKKVYSNKFKNEFEFIYRQHKFT